MTIIPQNIYVTIIIYNYNALKHLYDHNNMKVYDHNASQHLHDNNNMKVYDYNASQHLHDHNNMKLYDQNIYMTVILQRFIADYTIILRNIIDFCNFMV
jgi:hypothetical protein